MQIYKLSKIINKNKNGEKKIYTVCMYCKKYDTDKGWKSTDELKADPESREQILEVENDPRSLGSHIGLSHGICPDWMNWIRLVDWSRKLHVEEWQCWPLKKHSI
jgi:hypothetical protein